MDRRHDCPARQIKCPVLIGCGLRDDLAPPASVLAAANVITSPKELIILPIAWLYCTYGSKPQIEPAMRGIAAAVVAIVIAALIRLMQPMWRDPA